MAAMAVFCLCGEVGAQGLSGNTFLDWNFLGGGARARGMGGAYLGVSDGGDAGSWNPAGLVYTEGVLMTLNYARTRHSLDLDNGPVGQGIDPLSVNGNISNLPSASFVSPLTVMEREFIISVFYNRLQDGFTESEFQADVDPDLGSPFTTNYRLSGNIATVGGAIGTSLTDRLSIGGALQIVTGDGSEFYKLHLDSTRFPDPKNEHNESVTWTTQSDIDYGGLLFKLSAMYKADRWSAGAIYSPGWTLTQNLDFRSHETRVFSGIPGEFPLDGIYGPLAGTDREIDIPFTIGLGGSYQLRENLMLVADYQYRNFRANSNSESDDGSSGFRAQTAPGNPESPLEDLPVDWYNLHQIRVGAEYQVETSWGLIPLRLGFRNDPLLIGNDGVATLTWDQRLDAGKAGDFPYFSPMTEWRRNGDQVVGFTVTLGAGIHWSQVALDWAVEFGGFDYNESGDVTMIRRCPTCDQVIDPDVSTSEEWGKRKTYRWGDYSRKYDDSRVRFSLNFTGHF